MGWSLCGQLGLGKKTAKPIKSTWGKNKNNLQAVGDFAYFLPPPSS